MGIEVECPYRQECATYMLWAREKADFIAAVCNTPEYANCLHFSASLKPWHDERERLYGNPHAGEPDWSVLARRAAYRWN